MKNNINRPKKKVQQPAKVFDIPPQNSHFLFNIKYIRIVLFSILVITFISYLPSLKNGFILWDDPEYVTQSPHIKEIHLKTYFGEFYFSNYHPLTLLSYALDYKLFEFEPFGYHLENLFLHLINTTLVFYFVYFLTRKKQLLASYVTALLFAIHPMHVESVAWISERKDLLYSLFFILSLISYMLFLQNNYKKKYYFLSLLLFIISCLSKGQAVTLSLVLLLIDIYYARKFTVKSIMEKIPFFMLSVVFGILAVKAQGAQSAINENYYSNFTSLFFGSYGILTYLWKALLPVKLSGAYPYPLNPDRSMPTYFYLMPFIFSLLLFVFYKIIKKDKNFRFGILFFIATISVVLKFIPVGDTIVAERYSYLAYIGLFFAIGTSIEKISASWQQEAESMKNKKITLPGKNDRKGLILFIIFGIISTILCMCTFNRNKIWKDSFSFWGNVTQNYPHYWRAHNCIGEEYEKLGQMDKAAGSYNNAILNDKWAPPVPYMHLGALYMEHFKDYDKAIEVYTKVLTFPNKHDQSQIDGRHNLSLAYHRKGNEPDAITILNEAITLFPNHPKTYFLRGLAHSGMNEIQKAIADYSQAIAIQPNYLECYLNRGVIYTDKTNQYDMGIADFTNVLRIQPNHQDANINIGICYFKKGDLSVALQVYDHALQLFPNTPRVYYLKALVYAQMKDKKNAYVNAFKAKQLGMNIGEDVLGQWK